MGDKVEKTTEKLKLIAKKKKKKEKLHNSPEVTNDGDTVKELIKMAEDLKENSEVIAKKKKKKEKKDTVSVQEDGDVSVIKENGCARIGLEKDVLEKVENTSDQTVVCDKTPTDITLSEKKKKAKSEIVAETTTDSIQSPDSSEFFTPNTSIVAEVSISTDLSESKKKKKKDKKLKRSASEAGLSSIDKVVDEKGSELKQEPLLKPPEDTPSKLPKKMKKKKKEMHRIDSDIAFNAPSLSKINLMLGKSQDTKAEETLAGLPEPEKSEPSTPVLSAKKKKKMKKYNAETSLLNNEVSPVKPLVAPAFPSVEEKIETPKAEAEKKKKKKVATLDSTVPEKSISGVAPKSTKVFEEDSSWDAPLQPGETEIVLPNKSYKGTLKMSEAATVPGEGVLNGIVTPAKPSHTATFLKKALSKSVDGKKIKKEKSKTLRASDKCS